MSYCSPFFRIADIILLMTSLIIEKRKEKEYSSKIFNELCLFYVLILQGRIYRYEAESLLKVSRRTLYRYFSDLMETGLIHQIPESTETGKKELSYYSIFKNRNERIFLNRKHLLVDSDPIGLHSEDPHILRLTRLGMMLADAFRFDEDYKTNYDPVRLKSFYKKKKFPLSAKTMSRDRKLVMNVFDYMNRK